MPCENTQSKTECVFLACLACNDNFLLCSSIAFDNATALHCIRLFIFRLFFFCLDNFTFLCLQSLPCHASCFFSFHIRLSHSQGRSIEIHPVVKRWTSLKGASCHHSLSFIHPFVVCWKQNNSTTSMFPLSCVCIVMLLILYVAPHAAPSCFIKPCKHATRTCLWQKR